MQVTETLSQGLKREFKVVLPATDLATRLEGQLSEMQAKARINGFRPGKVPVAHLKRLYGRSIMTEVVQEAVNEAHRKIVEDNALRPAAQPKFDFPGEQDELEKAFEAQSRFRLHRSRWRSCRRSRLAVSTTSRSCASSPRSRTPRSTRC